ncbi:O-antigen translocase [Flavobacterium qiangtangense]|uniref:O-antigen translocase n=1 Tax=Flavobacterium qiangtangense TaxID=1442595 RepID=A0ABW1PRL2_9FLAO
MNFNREIFKSSLFKVTSLNSVSVVLKIITGLISSKIIAVFLGAPGMALVGNMRNFFTSMETISTLGFQNGIVKYSAENQENESELKKVISTIFFSLIGASIIFGLILFLFATNWNDEVFGSDFSYGFVFKILALTLPFYVINLFLISVINGFGKFKAVIFINIFGNLIGLLVSIFLIYRYNVAGALISIAITPALLFFLSLFYSSKEFSLTKNISLSSFNFSIIKNLSSYSIMALVYGFIGPLVYLAIRNYIIENLGIDQAGYWSAMERISSNYLLFISTLLSVYFLPKLVLAQNNLETKKVFWSYYKTILPVFILCLSFVYIFRNIIVKILFTEDMLPVSNLFFWQLVGDVFKASSIILGYQFFAKKMTKAFVITEIFSLTTLYFSSIYFVNIFQIEGIVIAHAFTYGIYLLVLSIYFRRSLF